MIVASVTGTAMLMMIGLVLGITLRGHGGPAVAPKQDTNPTGRETPRIGFPTFPDPALADRRRAPDADRRAAAWHDRL